MELPLDDSPTPLDPVRTERDTAGVLFGLDAPEFPTRFDLPAGDVRVVTAKLLFPSEVDYAAEHRADGRRELARRFAADGSHHRSSLTRKPVI
jgi:hypothetical protein